MILEVFSSLNGSVICFLRETLHGTWEQGELTPRELRGFSGDFGEKQVRSAVGLYTRTWSDGIRGNGCPCPRPALDGLWEGDEVAAPQPLPWFPGASSQKRDPLTTAEKSSVLLFCSEAKKEAFYYYFL